MFKVPTPAQIHSHMSHLQLAANDMSYANLLTKAANESDPLERLKKIAIFGIAAHTLNPSIVQMKVPLNPILGETLQRELETGERFYAEQISHHPPITAYSCYGPNGEFEYHGHHQLKAWLNGTSSLGGCKEGNCILKF